MEMYKPSNNMFPRTLNNIFAPMVTPYDLCNLVSFKIWKVHLIYNGAETLFHIGPKIWNLVPHEIRQSVSLGDFKQKIKNRLH